MPHPREKSPGSFRDELGGVIERVAPNGEDRSQDARQVARKARSVDTAELNDRLFEQRLERRAIFS